MSPFDPVDLYCERLGPEWWAEPLNALSNLAFLLAAWWLLQRLGRKAPWDLRLLAWLEALVGCGSLVFHTVAQAWADVLDVAFIALFVLIYMHRALRRLYGWSPLGAAAGVVGLAALSGVAAKVLTLPVLNGSGLYAGPWLGLLALTLGCSQPRPRAWLARATLLFLPSVTLRSLDLALCAHFPLGTHFGWHVLNAAVLWCCVRALMDGPLLRERARPIPERRTP